MPLSQGSFTEFQIFDLIVSNNIARRHLNPSQRNLLGAEYEEHYHQAAKEAQAAAGGDKFRRNDPDQQEPLVADLPQAVLA
ncbi:MAG: hypothetical protein ACRDTS_13065, partial [Mycobacterium sp.]